MTKEEVWLVNVTVAASHQPYVNAERLADGPASPMETIKGFVYAGIIYRSPSYGAFGELAPTLFASREPTYHSFSHQIRRILLDKMIRGGNGHKG